MGNLNVREGTNYRRLLNLLSILWISLIEMHLPCTHFFISNSIFDPLSLRFWEFLYQIEAQLENVVAYKKMCIDFFSFLITETLKTVRLQFWIFNEFFAMFLERSVTSRESSQAGVQNILNY